MDLPQQFQRYRTPDKRTINITHTNTKSTNAAARLPPSNMLYSFGLQSQNKSFMNQSVNEQQNDKLKLLEEKFEELRDYLNNNNHIDKKIIRRIFNWADEDGENDDKQRKILKQLSSRVKGLIKENNLLRQNNHKQEIARLKHENMKLQKIVQGLHNGQEVRENILDEENRYLRDYIDRNKFTSGSREIKIEEIKSLSSRLQQIGRNQIDSQHINVKQELFNYIKYVMSSNEAKFNAQGRYIDSLQNRIMNLQEIQKQVEHMRFQRKVALQDSIRRRKALSMGTPNLKGQIDEDIYEDDQIQIKNQPHRENEQSIVRKLFAGKPYYVEDKRQLKSILQLNRQLEQDYDLLKQKYEIQIQNHIRDNSDRQELLLNIQKLKMEKGDLRKQIEQLIYQLHLQQHKFSNVKIFMGENDATQNAIKMVNELKSIRESIELCNSQYFGQMLLKYSKLLKERNSLKQQLIQIKTSVSSQSKFSVQQKEVFFLKQKNIQLKQTCQFYQRQITLYEQKLREISQETEKRLVSNISQDIRQMISNPAQFQAEQQQNLKWQQKMHSCMLIEIDRLSGLQKLLQGRVPINT